MIQAANIDQSLSLWVTVAPGFIRGRSEVQLPAHIDSRFRGNDGMMREHDIRSDEAFI